MHAQLLMLMRMRQDLVEMVGVNCYIPVASISDFFCKQPKYRVRKLINCSLLIKPGLVLSGN